MCARLIKLLDQHLEAVTICCLIAVLAALIAETIITIGARH